MIKARNVKDWAPVRDKMDGKYHCEICEYATICRNDLMKHNRVHSGEKPFKCKRCAQAFTRKHHLDRHARVHE